MKIKFYKWGISIVDWESDKKFHKFMDKLFKELFCLLDIGVQKKWHFGETILVCDAGCFFTWEFGCFIS